MFASFSARRVVPRIFLAGLLCAAVCAAQPGRLKFDHLGEEANLAEVQISAALQDHRGFLWIGTTDGLAMYDGVAFRFYRQSIRRNSVSENDVRAIVEDEQGNLWLGIWGGGINRFDPRNESFFHIRHDPDAANSLASDQVRDLEYDAEGALWIATLDRGLDRYDPASGSFRHFRHEPSDPNSIGNDTVYAVERDRDGMLWIAGEGGVDLLNPATERFTHFRHDPDDSFGLAENHVESILPSRDGTVWVGTFSEGLNRLDPSTGAARRFPPDHDGDSGPSRGTIYALQEDSRGRLWIGAEFGLDLYDPETERFHHYRHDQSDPASLHFDRITHLFQDRSEVLWIGSSRGLDRLNPRTEAFVHYRPDPKDPRSSLPHPRVQTVTEAHGKTWIGTMNGLAAIDQETGSFTHYDDEPDSSSGLQNDYVTWAETLSDGSLWLATGYAGIARFDPETETFTHLIHDPEDPRSLPINDVLRLTEDSDGRLWIGTWGGGLSRLDPEFRAPGKERFINYRHDPDDPQSLSDDFAVALTEDVAGRLWIATWWQGLERIDPETGTFQHYPALRGDPAGPSNQRIYWIEPDPEDRLWLGTEAGLNLFQPETETFQYFLEEFTVFSVLQDELDQLWLGTNRGLVRFDRMTREPVQTYDTGDGVQGSTFNFQAAYRNDRGEFYFGGRKGLNHFDPKAVIDNPYPPPVALSEVLIVGRSVDPRDRTSSDGFLELRHNENTISLKFAALDFTAPRKNRFSYRISDPQIDDSEDSWVDLPRGEITFPRLPIGEHVIRVKASNNQGVWNEAGATLRLRVLPPWWRRAPFLLLWFALVAGLIFGVHRWRLLTVQKYVIALEKEIEQRREVEEELEAKNAELENFNYTVSHDLKSPLLTIRGFVGMLRFDAEKGRVERFENHISRVEEGVTRMQELLDDLLELSRVGRLTGHTMEADLAGIAREAARAVEYRIRDREAEILIDEHLIVRRIDTKRLHQVFQNLIDNGVKFVPEGRRPRIEVTVRRDGEKEIVVVRDNGPGVPPRYHEKIFALFERHHHDVPGTGVGLALVRRIIQLHGGKIWVESDGEDDGSSFCFTLAGIEAPTRKTEAS